MKKGRVILDVDDVLCPTSEEVINLYNKEYGTNITINDIVNYSFVDCPAIEYDAMKYFNDPTFFKRLIPYSDALFGVMFLQKHGYDVAIATATKRIGYNVRHDWLVDYFPTVPEKNIMFCSIKDALVADWIFDDKLETLLNNKSKNVVCKDRPWNNPVNHPEAAILTRVSSFKEFVDHIIETDFSLFQKACS